MRIVYNGVDLFCIETRDYSMECVMDDTGTDYLYTRHTVIVRALVNGQVEIFQGRNIDGKFLRSGPAITYSFQGGTELYADGGGIVELTTSPPPEGGSELIANKAGDSLPPIGGGRAVRDDPMTPVPNGTGRFLGRTPPASGLDVFKSDTLFEIVPAPNSPTVTMQTIRHRLTTPRGRLFVFSGGWDGAPPAPVMLISPLPGAFCDCKNGPIPKLFGITQAFGDATTFVVDFAIETYINEGFENGVQYGGGPLLSNRFSQTQQTGEDSYTTVLTEGLALFRTDLVYSLPVSPDRNRPILFMPIPLGFVRENIVVKGLPDVTGVNYSFQDRQVPVNFTAGPYARAAKISAVHRQAVVANEDILRGAMSTYERVLGIAANRNIAKPHPGTPNKNPKVPYNPPPSP